MGRFSHGESENQALTKPCQALTARRLTLLARPLTLMGGAIALIAFISVSDGSISVRKAAILADSAVCLRVYAVWRDLLWDGKLMGAVRNQTIKKPCGLGAVIGGGDGEISTVWEEVKNLTFGINLVCFA